jgi:hypothetical protein
MNKNVKTHATGARRKIAAAAIAGPGRLPQGRPLKKAAGAVLSEGSALTLRTRRHRAGPTLTRSGHTSQRHEARDVLRDKLYPHCRPQRIDAEAT